MAKEIERRFLLAGPPPIDLTGLLRSGGARVMQIEQRYVRRTGDWTTRIRRIVEDRATTYTLTMKLPLADFGCDEIEPELTEQQHADLAEHCGPAILKTRWRVSHGDHVIEIDRYDNPELAGLCIAEVELPSRDAPLDAPDWFGREISDERWLSNAALARFLDGRWPVAPTMTRGWVQTLADVMGPESAPLREFLMREMVSGARLMPPPHLAFSAFQHADPCQTRVVVLGQDPYPTAGNAHGLSFSVQHGVGVPQSLANILRELKDDVGATPPGHGNLEDWSRQGVLLLNAVLSTRAGESNVHKGRGWERITDAAIRAVSDCAQPTVFILWGRHAQKKRHLVDESRHLVIESAHPSPMSATTGFFGSRPFSRANEFLAANGRGTIDWQLGRGE